MVHAVIRGTASECNTSATKGWIVGHFGEDLQKSDGFEIKSWHYDSEPDYPAKQFNGTEFIIVYGGTLRINASVDGKDFTDYVLSGEAQDYIIFPPGTIKTVHVPVTPSFGITVRWPSVPGGNIIL